MGMYTEIFFRAEVDVEAANIISALRDGDKLAYPWPDHEFFKCPRFNAIAVGSSYYFPGANHLELEYDGPAHAWFVSFRANLKNYGDEIDKFFDWVDPHIQDIPGSFIGYSMYEEDETPTLRFKGVTS